MSSAADPVRVMLPAPATSRWGAGRVVAAVVPGVGLLGAARRVRPLPTATESPDADT